MILKSLFRLREMWDMSKVCKHTQQGPFLCSVFLCSLKPLNQISISFLLLCLVWILQTIIMVLLKITIKGTATEKSASFYSILLDYFSLGFSIAIDFWAEEKNQNERSPFVQWLTLTSRIDDCGSPTLVSSTDFFVPQKHYVTAGGWESF